MRILPGKTSLGKQAAWFPAILILTWSSGRAVTGITSERICRMTDIPGRIILRSLRRPGQMRRRL